MCGQTGNYIAALVTTSLAWVLSIVAIASCTFMRVEDSYSNTEHDFGLFGYRLYSEGSCQEWETIDKNDFDGSTKAARACGVVATVFAGIMAVVVLPLSIFLKFPVPVWKILGVVALFCMLMQLITYLFVKQIVEDFECDSDANRDCKPGAAAIMSAIVAILFLAAGCIMLCMVPPDEPLVKCGQLCSSGPPAGEKAVAQEVPAATAVQESTGTKVVEMTETINPDGSKTIVRTEKMTNV